MPTSSRRDNTSQEPRQAELVFAVSGHESQLLTEIIALESAESLVLDAAQLYRKAEASPEGEEQALALIRERVGAGDPAYIVILHGSDWSKDSTTMELIQGAFLLKEALPRHPLVGFAPCWDALAQDSAHSSRSELLIRLLANSGLDMLLTIAPPDSVLASSSDGFLVGVSAVHALARKLSQRQVSTSVVVPACEDDRSSAALLAREIGGQLWGLPLLDEGFASGVGEKGYGKADQVVVYARLLDDHLPLERLVSCVRGRRIVLCVAHHCLRAPKALSELEGAGIVTLAANTLVDQVAAQRLGLELVSVACSAHLGLIKACRAFTGFQY